MKRNYKIKITENITPHIRAIRDEVFIREQNIPEDEEYKDDEAVYTHFCLYNQDTPAACTRMLCTKNIIRIMRVAVLKSFRGLGIGNKIMEFTESEAKRRGCKTAVVNSQVQSREFYEKLGYRAEGKEFMESGIPHIRMTKKL